MTEKERLIYELKAKNRILSERLQTIERSLAWRLIQKIRFMIDSSFLKGSKSSRYCYSFIQWVAKLFGVTGLPTQFYKTNILTSTPTSKIQNHSLVSILIPFRDGANLLKKCVDSILQKSTYLNFEIIAINNQSKKEDTFFLINELIQNQRIKFHDFPEDFNYSKINNFGASFAKGDYLIFLNNDTEIITPNWIESMLEFCQNDEVGAVGPRLYYPDGTIQHDGIMIGMHDLTDHIDKGLVPTSAFISEAKEVLAVTGACFMVKKKLFEQLGGFDENFKIYLNDVDFCLRLFEKGLINMVVPQVELYHFEGASLKNLSICQNQILEEKEEFMKRHSVLIANGDPYFQLL